MKKSVCLNVLCAFVILTCTSCGYGNITESDSLEHLPHYEDSLAAVCELYSYNLEKGNSDYLTTYDIQINVLI